MRVLETQWWRLGLPDEWIAEQDEDSILITDRDDVGTIEISHLVAEEGDPQNIEALARDNAEQPGLSWEPCVLGDFDGLQTRYREDEASIREWWLQAGSLILFVTYVCEIENEGLDESIVDEILDGLEMIREE